MSRRAGAAMGKGEERGEWPAGSTAAGAAALAFTHSQRTSHRWPIDPTIGIVIGFSYDARIKVNQSTFSRSCDIEIA